MAYGTVAHATTIFVLTVLSDGHWLLLYSFRWYADYHNLDRKGKSMLTEPWPDSKMPLILLAYELFRNAYILSNKALRSFSCAPILMRDVGWLPSCLTLTISFISVKVATAFLMVSDEMDSRWVLMRSLMSDWPNHCISVMNLGAGMAEAFFSNLKR